MGHRGAAIALLLAGLAVQAPLLAADAPRASGSVFRACEACPEMVVVPAGSFVMGTPAAALPPGRPGAESGTVVIGLPHAFAMGVHEVTRREFAHFVAQSGYESHPGCRTWDPALARFNEDARRTWQNPATPAVPLDEHPVTCVSFADAGAYVQWLAHETGASYRLPSEAEWEYAARAGTTTLRYWGDASEDGCGHANTYDVTADSVYRLGWPHAGCRDGYGDLAPVGSFAANPFGLHDMIGNVREWVQDCATDSYVGRPRDARAWEWLGGCKRRIQRGGSWLAPPDGNRSAFRGDAAEGDRSDDAGFRVAMDLDQREAHAEAH
jgi:formylglycine-generating enzyme required for sulfatase activity